MTSVRATLRDCSTFARTQMTRVEPTRGPTGWMWRFMIHWRYVVALLVCVAVYYVELVIDAGDYDVNYILKVAYGLADTCGVRVTGTAANEVCAVDYLVATLSDAQEINPDITIEVSTSGNGSFYLDFIDGINLAYDQLHNVIVRVPAAPQTTQNVTGKNTTCSLLVSAHFDSAHGSPGLSDDAAQIGMMADYVRQLAKSPLPIDVVFNFNGAEEVIMQGAHAFITQYPGADQLCAMINLESCGPFGRETPLQVGSRWIARSYAASVRDPYVQSFFGFFFGLGLLPGDTDYRVYRDFWRRGKDGQGGGKKKLRGVDFVTVRGGVRYHTARDTLIDEQSIKHYAGNVYSVMRQMATDIYDQKHNECDDDKLERTVIFDIFGYYTAVVPLGVLVALVVLDAVGIVRALYSQKDTRHALWTHITGPLCCIFVSLVTSLVPVAVEVALQSWVPTAHVFLTNKNIITPLFMVFPILTTMYMLGYDDDDDDKTDKIRCAPLLYHILFLTPVAIGARGAAGMYSFALLATIPPLGLLTSLTPACVWFATGAIMEMGNRATTEIPFHLISVVLASLCISLTLAGVANSGYVPKLRCRRTYWGGIGVTTLTIVVLTCGGVLPNYTPDAPQRLYVQHVLDERSGNTRERNWFYFLLACDFNRLQILENEQHTAGVAVPWLPDHTRHDKDALYGNGLPYPLPAHHMLASGGVAPAHRATAFALQTKFASNSYSAIPGGVRIRVLLRDAAQVVVLLPASISTWSLAHPIPVPHKHCNCHYILFAHGGMMHDKERRVWDLEVMGNVSRVDMHAFYFDMREKVANWAKLPEDVPWVLPNWTTTIFWHSHLMPSFVA
eukprot:GEMP01008206.1.p1 GENE.GEMP01008206.1~~GEMP01008206.1.p1  ORF type:complete len:842 (+),score=183.79 GEMP01008206.1:286-2811(+)